MYTRVVLLSRAYAPYRRAQPSPPLSLMLFFSLSSKQVKAVDEVAKTLKRNLAQVDAVLRAWERCVYSVCVCI